MPRLSIPRRRLLEGVSAGFGFTAFRALAAEEAGAAAGPLAPKPPHFPPRAKRVIFLCMRGGPSHMETFDPKPKLTADNGKPGRLGSTRLLGSRWGFTPAPR